jgi:catechol 2,3-dioxygenase-like lactoylglutathione lyase family enzyme
MKVKRLTPIYMVNKLEDLLPFWVDRLGYRLTVKVPDEGSEPLVFAILHREKTEVMLQTIASAIEEVPSMATRLEPGMCIHYMEVDDLDEALKAFSPEQIVAAERSTFYGTREVVVVDPAGNLLEVAQRIQ